MSDRSASDRNSRCACFQALSLSVRQRPNGPNRTAFKPPTSGPLPESHGLTSETRSEAPRLAAAAKAHAGSILFVGIDVQDFKSDARRFLTKYRANYVSVRDGGDSTYSAYGLTGLPETYLDRRGRILAHSVGEVSKTELEQGITLITRASR
jgi:hypothetical protein